jgi:hypothetical protein
MSLGTSLSSSGVFLGSLSKITVELDLSKLSMPSTLLMSGGE